MARPVSMGKGNHDGGRALPHIFVASCRGRSRRVTRTLRTSSRMNPEFVTKIRRERLTEKASVQIITSKQHVGTCYSWLFIN